MNLQTQSSHPLPILAKDHKGSAVSSKPEPRQMLVCVLLHQGTSSPSLVLDAK